MASVNNEGINTHKMGQHQLTRRINQPAAAPHDEIDLVMCADVTDLSQCVALNSRSDYASVENAMLANPSDQCLLSDVDHQLLIKVFFKEPVTILGFGIRATKGPLATKDTEAMPIKESQAVEEASDTAPLDELDEEILASAPRVVKLYSNKENLDFSEIDAVEAAQRLEFTAEELNGERIPLRGTKFQRCKSFQIFIEENIDDTPLTFLNRVRLWGYISPSYHTEYI